MPRSLQRVPGRRMAAPDTAPMTRRDVLLRSLAVPALGFLGEGVWGGLHPQAAQAASTTTYSWCKGATDGGGFCNVIATDPHTPGGAVAGGDVWGEHTTNCYGSTWVPRMIGATGIGDIYARAAAFSLKTPGLAYVGIGTLKGGGGYFGAVNGWNLEKRSRSVGFGTSLASGAAGNQPRAVGALIQVDFDSGSGVEYIYALTNKGLARSVDGGSSWQVLGLTSVPGMAWSALCLVDSNTLLVSSYRTSASSGSKVWKVTNIRSNPTFTQVSGAPAVVEHIGLVGGGVFAACGPYGLYSVGSTWTKIAGTTFTGCNVSALDGSGQTLYVGTAGAPKSSGRSVAKSTDGGKTWSWVTGPKNITCQVAGTSRTWWLGGQKCVLGGDAYDASQIAVDRFDPSTCYVAGRSGVWVTRDGGASWAPSMNGLNGSEVQNVRAASGGTAYAKDVDWVGASTSNSWGSAVRTTNPGSFGSAALSRQANGHTFAIKTGAGRDITMDGKSIADSYFMAAAVSPTDIAIASDGCIYVGLYGGGVLVGTPG